MHVFGQQEAYLERTQADTGKTHTERTQMVSEFGLSCCEKTRLTTALCHPTYKAKVALMDIYAHM